MAGRKSRQTFEKARREQAVRERRELKQQRKAAARIARAAGEPPAAGGAGALDGTRAPAD